MPSLKNKEQSTRDYQDNLDAVKAQGSIEKQSKLPDPPKRSFNLKSEKSGRVPFRNTSVPSFPGKNAYGTSSYDADGELLLPSSIFESSLQGQKQILETEVEEFRAQNQPGIVKFGAIVPNTLMKTGIEFIRGLGYIGAIPLAAVEGDISKIADNEFTAVMDEFEEAYKEAVPVYVRREVRDGTFLRNLWSPEFWATEAADGIGFFASAILTGGVANAAIKPITKAISGAAKYAKIAEAGGKVGINTLNNAKRTEETLRLLSTTTAQSYVESMAESHGALKEFKTYWDQYRQEDGTYVKENPDGSTTILTEDDLAEKKADLMSATFGFNMAVTALPNWFMSQAFFGSGGAFSNAFRRLGILPKEADKGIAKAMNKSMTSSIGSQMLQGAISEGAQENLQYAIQRAGERRSQELENINMMEGILDGIGEAFTTVEGQKSMFLGALLGMFGGAKKGHSEYKAGLKQASDLKKLLDNQYINMETLVQDYTIQDEDGELTINAEKIKNDFKDAEAKIRDVVLMQMAKIEGLPLQAKAILGKMLVREALPYFSSPEHMEMLNGNIDNLIENINGIEQFGFESKEEAREYISNLFQTAETSLKKARKDGPRGFNLNVRELYDTLDQEDETTISAVENIYNAMEAQYALQSALVTEAQKDLQKKDMELEKIKTEADAAYTLQFPEGKAETTEAKLRAMGRPENQIKDFKSLLSDQITLKAVIEDINKKMNLFFDKKEQQAAINDQIREIKKEKKRQEDIKKGQEESERFNTNFRDRLVQLGWFSSPEELQQSINDGTINDIALRMKDNKGGVWTMKKITQPKNNSKRWYLFPVDTTTGEVKYGERPEETGLLVSLDLMKELGIDENSIMTKQEYNQWKAEKDAVRINSQYLDAVAETLDLAEYTKQKTAEDIAEKKKRLNEINETIQNISEDTVMDVSVITEQITTLENERAEIQDEIRKLDQSIYAIEEEIEYYLQLREILIEARRNKVQIDLTSELKTLQENLKEDGIYTKRSDRLRDLQEALLTDIENLRDIELGLTEAIDNLYSILKKAKVLETMLDKAPLELKRFVKDNIEFFRENYPEFLRDANDPDSEVRNFKFMDALFDDADIRSDFLAAIKSDIKDGKAMLSDIKFERTAIRNAIKDALSKYDTIDNYLTLQQRVESVLTAHDIQQRALKGRGIKKIQGPQTQNQKERIEQRGGKEVEEDLGGPRKEWMYSTISSFFEMDGTTPKLQGTKEYKQATDWARAMYNIPLSELSGYSIRPVTAQGLKELGQEPPESEPGSLYAVLIKDGAPYRTEDGSPVFAGIATTGYYFPFAEDNTTIEPRINFANDPDYLAIVNRTNPISKENPYSVTINGETKRFENEEDAIQDLFQRRKAEYNQWREGIVKDLNEGKDLNFRLRHISRGWPSTLNNSTNLKKNNPKKALNASAVFVPKRNTVTLDNGEVVQVTPGMPYVKLPNGHLQRVMNFTIADLPEKSVKGEDPKKLTQEKVINRMLAFMALAAEAGGNVKKVFRFAGTDNKQNLSTFDQLPLAGSSNRPGILDFYINWNADERKNPAAYNIHFAVLPKNKKVAIRWKTGTEKESWVTVDELFDKQGNLRKMTDPHPKIQEIVSFLKTKYLNVVAAQTSNPKTGKPKAFRLPKGVDRNGNITYDFYDNYDDFVMDNYLYTSIPPATESSSAPPYVNQYIIFDKANTPVESMSAPAEETTGAPNNAAIVAELNSYWSQSDTTGTPEVVDSLERLNEVSGNVIETEEEKKKKKDCKPGGKKGGFLAGK